MSFREVNDAGGALRNMAYKQGKSGGALASSCEYEKESAAARDAFKKSRHNQDREGVPDICKQSLVDAGGAFKNTTHIQRDEGGVKMSFQEVNDMVYKQGESGGALASSCEYEKESAVAGGAFENQAIIKIEKVCQISANKAQLTPEALSKILLIVNAMKEEVKCPSEK